MRRRDGVGTQTGQQPGAGTWGTDAFLEGQDGGGFGRSAVCGWGRSGTGAWGTGRGALKAARLYLVCRQWVWGSLVHRAGR